MGTLKPDLLSKDMDAVLNEAADLRREYRHQTVTPEIVLLTLLRKPDTAARRLLNVFQDTRGVDVARLTRQVELAVQSRRDQNGNLDFIARGNKKVPLSRQTIIMLDDALSVANSMHEVRIDTEHALTVLSESSMSTSGLLRQEGLTPKAIKDVLSDSSQVLPRKQGGTTTDFVQQGRMGDLRAVYFREDLLREMINIISQAVTRHIILLGPDGVGKRTLAYSLALLMSEGSGPEGLSSLVQIDETSLLDNEQQAVRAGMSKARNGILFVPHIHRFFGGPAKAEFAKATSMVQKAFLTEDPVIIGSTTELEYNQRITNVSAVTENSTLLRVPEPSVNQTIEMLMIKKPHLESDYDITIQPDAVRLAANLSKRYLSVTPLPRSAEQLLHRTAAMVSLGRQQQLAFKPDTPNDGLLDVEDITLAASQLTGIPVSKLGEDERMRYARMVEHLQEHIIGQDEAVMAVSRAIKTARVGLKDAKRPIGAFLFLGPTGVGKTELARVLAEFMFGSQEDMLPLDMSEFKDDSSVNRLIGSPTGYIGSEEGGQLTERVRQQPYIIVLFDEVEKAHPRILDLLLQVIEEGRLTDGRGQTTRFTEAVIILTSNIGSEHLSVPYVDEGIREQVMDEVREFLRPEFINRLDDVVMFNALSNTHLENIMRLLLEKEQQLAEERGLSISFTDGAVKWLSDQNNQPEYGARPLKRIIRRFVREPLADFLLRTNPPAGTAVRVSASRKKDGGLKFTSDADGDGEHEAIDA
jgi:ATP-dependent Clp protease ATP-binding subunit ClpC